MNDKTDPICGMQGTIEKYDHYFCSKNCVEKYEKQNKIETKKTLPKPLIYTVVTVLLIGLVAFLQTSGYMIQFMGVFFVLVAILKMLDWKGFANAFSMYDIIAKKSKVYSYVYPVIELGLGLSYLLSWNVRIAAVVTFIIMTIGSIGVGKNLLSKNPIKCACLGTLIKIPLTKFTLFEDISMAVMALMILL